MAGRFRTFALGDLKPSQRYDLMSGLVVPRPIAFVSTVSAEGQPNLAPFSYFMVGGISPPSLVFCPVLDLEGKPKGTLRNAEATGEFVVNLVERRMAEGMNVSSFPYSEGESEWGVSGFTPLQSERVRPSRVAESPVQFECRLYQALRHGEGPGASVYVVGEVLVAHVSDALVNEAAELVKPFGPLARLGGKGYLDLELGEAFEMARPNRPAGSSLD